MKKNESGRINPVLDHECGKEFDEAQWQGKAYVKGETSDEHDKEPKRGKS